MSAKVPVLVACMQIACLHGSMAFVVGPTMRLRSTGLSLPKTHAPWMRRQSLALFMQKAPEDLLDPLKLLVKSELSSRKDVDLFVGEDAAVFDWENEKMGELGERGWLSFFAAVGTILSALAVLWIYPATGYSDDFLAFLEDLTDGNSHLVTLIFGIIFPIVHSGLASLRPYGEKIVGARTWRVIFAWPSLCLAYSWITYFISHAHDGIVVYDGTQIGWLHTIAWCMNFASFFFLYPSVFNLKEVAAVDVPRLHLWETGIIRITRHPQFVGQSMWSAAHLMMVLAHGTLTRARTHTYAHTIMGQKGKGKNPLVSVWGMACGVLARVAAALLVPSPAVSLLTRRLCPGPSHTAGCGSVSGVEGLGLRRRRGRGQN